MNYSFIAEGKPQVKQRPRMTRRGRVFTPEKTLLAEQAVAAQYKGPLFEGPVAVEMRFGIDYIGIHIADLDYQPIKGLRGDLDNYVKMVADGLNGIAWNDDRQIKSVYAYFDLAVQGGLTK